VPQEELHVPVGKGNQYPFQIIQKDQVLVHDWEFVVYYLLVLHCALHALAWVQAYQIVPEFLLIHGEILSSEQVQMEVVEVVQAAQAELLVPAVEYDKE
jgi:hypothetical protein